MNNQIVTKLHLACSKDELRATLNYILIDDNFAIATDTMIMVKMDLTTQMDEEFIGKLNGKMIHRTQWALMVGKLITEVDDEKIRVFDGNSGYIDLPFHKDVEKFPDYRELMNIESRSAKLDSEGEYPSMLAFNPDILSKLAKAMFAPKEPKSVLFKLHRVTFSQKYHGNTRAIFVFPNYKSQCDITGGTYAVLMPQMVDESFADYLNM